MSRPTEAIGRLLFKAGTMVALLGLGAVANALEVLRVSPAGNEAPPGRQVVIHFSAPVVALGAMERDAAELPIRIQPALNCEWRWLNPQDLACALTQDDAMRPATEYVISIDASLRTDSGQPLGVPFTHRFVTTPPTVRYVQFAGWLSPEQPEFVVSFDQPVRAESIRRTMSIRRADERFSLAVSPAESESPENAAADRWRLRATKPLHAGARHQLHIEPGLVSSLGPVRGRERRVVLEFDTFPTPAVLGVTCRSPDTNKSILVSTRISSNVDCDPSGDLGLAFNVPIATQSIASIVSVEPHLPESADGKNWGAWSDGSSLRYSHRLGAQYIAWLPVKLKPDTDYRFVAEQSSLTDAFGRPFPTGIDERVHIAHRRPSFFLNHPYSVLESQVDSEVPIWVTNLDRLNLDYRQHSADNTSVAQSSTLDVPTPQDKPTVVPLKVRSILEQRSGIVSGTISSVPSDRDRPSQSFVTIVSPFHVHAKIGHFNSWIWVVDFRTGEPVAGADVSIYLDDYRSLQGPREVAHTGVTDAQGLARLPGSETLDPNREFLEQWRAEAKRWMVEIRREDEIGVLPLDQSFRIHDRSQWPSPQKQYGHLRLWGVTAQGVYRTGETIDYKLFVRHQNNETLTEAPIGDYTLTVFDPTGKPVGEPKTIKWSAFGTFAGELPIRKTAPVGWYRFQIKASVSERTWPALRVLVSDFTPAPFRVATELNGSRFGPGDTLVAQAAATLHAGGPYADAPVRLLARVKATALRPSHPHAKTFHFTTDAARNPGWRRLSEVEGTLDRHGRLDSTFTVPDSPVVFGTLEVESAVQSSRGKSVAALRATPYVGRDRFVGVRTTRWVYPAKTPARFESIVVDADLQPFAGVAQSIALDRRDTKAARVKSAGNTYVTQYTHRWVSEGTCQVTSGVTGSACTLTPPQAGTYRISATITDTKGREHQSSRQFWVTGTEAVLWEEPKDATLVLSPENTELSVGDTARVLIRNPYPGALAWITTERYGVIDHRVQRLESSTPVIEVPITPDMIPGVYLSVTVVSPRVASTSPIGKVDLGKPAFRAGYLQLNVTDNAKQLTFSIHTEKPVYKPGETVVADIQTHFSSPSADRDVELAVAVLDEAVFDLVAGGNRYFDPYRGLYRLASLDVRNYGLLTRLIGRQNFETKGANAGGDGGGGPSFRQNFKYLSYWSANVPVDAHGKSTVRFEVPDNLTGWRIIAIAVNKSDRAGMGFGTFKVNRPTEIRPVLPNQVTEGDRFRAAFEVMNRLDTPRAISGTIATNAPGTESRSSTFSFALAPYARKLVEVDVIGSAVGPIRFDVSAGDDLDRDGVRSSIATVSRHTTLTAANYGSTDRDVITERFKVPAGIAPGVSEIATTLSPSVLGNLEGAFAYMRDYPYQCWEQVLSKGTMALHYRRLRAYLPEDFRWEAAQHLPEQTLRRARDHQTPSGGMAYWIPDDAYVSPYLSAFTALAFAWYRKAGLEPEADVENALRAYLDRLLRDDAMPDFYSRGMAATVRAVALAALSHDPDFDPTLLYRYESHLPHMTVFGKSHYLAAATRAGARDLAENVTRALLDHSHLSSGKVSFNESVNNGRSQRILATPLRTQCGALAALTLPGAAPDSGELAEKLARTILQARGNRDHWENTQENLFCADALAHYASHYETTAPDMRLDVTLDGNNSQRATLKGVRDAAKTIVFPLSSHDDGQARTLRIQREGTGRVYFQNRITYALKTSSPKPVNAGIDVRREYSVERAGGWEPIDGNTALKRGELIRVDLFVSLPTARHFVVVDDPIPGGWEAVNADLGTTSRIDAEKATFKPAADSWWHQHDDWQRYGRSRFSFYHHELRHDRATFYADYLPPGNYHLSYAAQAIAVGEFVAAPVKANEMYDADIFGIGAPTTIKVDGQTNAQ
ncbi:MAG: MG2 domain-containing protein [Pseudomonadota bacterium]